MDKGSGGIGVDPGGDELRGSDAFGGEGDGDAVDRGTKSDVNFNTIFDLV